MEIEKLIERLQNWDGIKPGRERQAQEGEGRGGMRSGNHYGRWRLEFGHLSILQKQPVLRKGRDKAMHPGMARLEGGLTWNG